MSRDRTTLLGCALFVLVSCSKAPPAAAADPAAAKAYAQAACATCHGPDGAGGPMGPSLRGLDKHWKQADLVDYLTQPAPWIEKSPRLAEQQKRFPMRMPIPDLSPAQREQVAALVLSWK